MEFVVLTQMRDSMSLINLGLTRLGERVDALNDGVVAVVAAKYDRQIADLRLGVEKALVDQEKRIRVHDTLLTKLGVGMAISSAIGTAALVGLVALILARIFGTA